MTDKSRFTKQNLPLTKRPKDGSNRDRSLPSASGAEGNEARVSGSVWRGVAKNPFTASCQDSFYGETLVHPRHGYFMNPDSVLGQSTWRVYQDYERSVPAVMAKVSEVARTRDLTPEEVTNLSLSAAVQEFLLLAIAEHIRPRPNYPVSVEGIRRSLFELPVDKPLRMTDVRPVRLVVIRVASSWTQPTPAQCEFLASLRLLEGTYAAVHFDRPETWIQLDELDGLITTERIVAELPCWDAGLRSRDVSLSEAALGLIIEESVFP